MNETQFLPQRCSWFSEGGLDTHTHKHAHTQLVNFPHARDKTDYSQIFVFLIGEILLLKLFHLKLFGESSTEIRSTTTSKDVHSTEGSSRSPGRSPSVECGISTPRPRYPGADPVTMRCGKKL